MKLNLKIIFSYLIFFIGFILCLFVSIPKTYISNEQTEMTKLLIFVSSFSFSVIITLLGLFFFYKNYKLMDNKNLNVIYLSSSILFIGVFALYIYLTYSYINYQIICGYIVSISCLISLLYILIKPYIKNNLVEA
mgnify:CR=1 FL=1